MKHVSAALGFQADDAPKGDDTSGSGLAVNYRDVCPHPGDIVNKEVAIV